MIEIKIKLEEGAIAPKRATADAAGYDLYCPQDTIVTCGRSIIPLNFKMELPKGYVADIRPRSGFSAKGFENQNGMRFNCDVLYGTIDADYRGIVGVIVRNDDMPFTIGKGARIAQMVVHKVEELNFVESTELSDTDRGTGGYGHSGVK